jgi:rod shape determining protein RodA
MRRGANILANTDWLSVGLYLILILLGWINIYAAVYNDEHQSIFDFSQSYGKQLIWISAAIVLIVIIYLIDTKFYYFFAYPMYILSILSLILLFVLGTEVHGARSWFQVGGFNLQPSEFAKIATCLGLAKYLSAYNLKIKSLRSTSWILAIIFLPSLLIALQPDMGSSLVFLALLILAYREGLSNIILFIGVLLIVLFFLALLVDKIIILFILIGLGLIAFWLFSSSGKRTLIATLMLLIPGSVLYGLRELDILEINPYFIVLLTMASALPVYFIYAYRKRLRYIALIVLMLAGSAFITFSVDYVFNNILKEHQQHRVNILLGIESDPLGIGYNVNQSKIAIGSGGLTGKGFLQGTQTKFDFVPEQSTDFIFCTIGEEWGFLGTSIVIGLFLFLMLRLIKIAERQRSEFSRVYGYGVISILFFHFTVNIGMTIGLLPVIGIPLPFFSYGGSSLWAFTILLFILLRLDASRMELLK